MTGVKFHLVVVALLIVTVNASVLLLKQNKFAEGSCEGICNRTGTIPGSCQCNTACIRFNDCCPDYYTLCLPQTDSCVGRCDQVGTIPGRCQCNKPCQEFGDCCSDYTDVCGGGTGGPITNQELEALAEELINLDANNVAQYVTVNLQGTGSQSCSNSDKAPLPLMNVSASAYLSPTVKLLLAMHDNYNPDVNVAESYTPEEEAEIKEFIDTAFENPLMQKLQEFLVSKNLPSGKDNFYTMWFGLYSRGNGGLGSCGFEHVFLGELKSGVSGFHNWVFFSKEEEAGRIDYRGYMDYVDFGSKGSVIEHNFKWRDQCKPISSMFIGTSPELEMALYTVCWNARPNAKCTISLNGNKIKIQTYTIGSSSQFVASAYPDLSD